MEIIWKKPSLNEESHEYFGTPETKELFGGLGYKFGDKESFLRVFNPPFDDGRLVQVDCQLTEAEGIGKINSRDPVPLEGEYGLQERVKTDANYGASYNKMLEVVQAGMPVTLPAPIYFYFQDEGFGFYFSGDRRKLLAHNLKLPLNVWWVDICEVAPTDEN